MSASIEFRKIFRPNELKNIFYSQLIHKSAKGIDGINIKVFESSLDKNIQNIIKKSLNGTYKFSFYKEKLITKGQKKFPRVISIPTIRDKLILKALTSVLNSVFGNKVPHLHNVINSVVEIKKLNKYDVVMKMDVVDFYPSVLHKNLFSILSKKIKKQEITTLLFNAITKPTVDTPPRKVGITTTQTITDKGVPQGLPISNILANIYMLPIDEKYGQKKSFAYFRYVDDILLFCKKGKELQIKQNIKNDLNKIGLEIHGEDEPSKNFTREIVGGFEYLGYKFNGECISVRESSIDNIRQSLLKIFTYYKYSHANLKQIEFLLNMRITGCKFNDTKYGWLFYFSQINDIKLLGSLDTFVKRQLVRFNISPTQMHPKKFIKTFHEMTKNLSQTNYIPDYDKIEIIEQKEILMDAFGRNTDGMSDKQINKLFRQKIFQKVYDLERDLSRIS
jgi:Retron-type reverse transcriptase